MNNDFDAFGSSTASKPPSTPQEQQYGPLLRAQPQRCTAGAGSRWIGQAWTLFKERPGLWIGMFLVLFLALIVLSLIPGLSLLMNLGFGLFTAGFIVGAYELDERRDLQFDHLFAGFKHNPGQLLLLGLLYFLGVIVICIPVLLFAFIGGGMSFLVHPEQGLTSGIVLLGIALDLLLAAALMIPLLMTVWFAPALIALNNMPAVDAMKLSFKACWENIGALTVFGLWFMLWWILAIIPLGLGLLVLFPVMYISYYTAYREIFTV